MFDHLPRSTIMNAISIGLYIVHSVLIENTTISSHSFQTKLKKMKRFLLLLLYFFFFIRYCSFAQVMIGTYCAFLKFTRQGWSKVIIKCFFVTIGLFSKENDWPLIDIESSLFHAAMVFAMYKNIHFAILFDLCDLGGIRLLFKWIRFKKHKLARSNEETK